MGSVNSPAADSAAPPPSARVAELTPAPFEREPTARGDFSSTIWRSIRKLLVAQRVLFLNAGLLAIGSVVSSAFGFFYWIFAARHFPAEAVGYAAAALALMNFIGHLGDIGLGPLLMGNARFGGRSNAIISGALMISFSASAALALVYIFFSTLFSVSLGDVLSSGGAVVFMFACALGGLTLVLDQALVGLLRSELTASRNFILAATKLLLIIAAPLVLGADRLNEMTLFCTWFGGQLVAVIFLVLMTDRQLLGDIFGRPDLGFFRTHFGDMVRHQGLNIAGMGAMLLPFLVTIVLTPTTNAAFNAAWTLINVAFLAPNSLAIMVFAVGAENPSGFAQQLRASLGVSMAIGVVVATICYFGSSFILSLFSPAYVPIANVSFQLLGLSIFPMAIKFHYVAIQRVRHQMGFASLFVALVSVPELTGAIIGGLHGGLLGLTVGWLLGLVGGTLLMTPTIIDALFPRSQTLAADLCSSAD